MDSYETLFDKLGVAMDTLRAQAKARNISIEKLIEYTNSTRESANVRQATEQIVHRLASMQEKPFPNEAAA